MSLPTDAVVTHGLPKPLVLEVSLSPEGVAGAGMPRSSGYYSRLPMRKSGSPDPDKQFL